MGHLAGFRYREIIKRLKQLGFKFDRHYTTIPNHPDDMPEGTLRAILKQAGITITEFLAR
jgi:predicted RNA binding protein YcfA (HicA-like mRNA interferase family)